MPCGGQSKLDRGSRCLGPVRSLHLPARLEHDDRPAERQREADLRKRAVTSADRDDRIARGDDGEVATVPDARHDGMVEPLVGRRPSLAGEDPDRRPAGGLRATRGGRHHLAETARDHGGTALGEEPPDCLGVLFTLGSAPDNGDLDHHLSAMLGHMTATRQARGGVLVVGGGFAGAYVARQLRDHGATIVSKDNFMLYTPLLPEAASGTLEPRHCVVPLRVMCPHAELILGAVTTFDLDTRTAELETDEGPQTVEWRELVLALGAVPRTLPVPGLAEHGLSFKTLADAINLRNHVLHQLEAADAALDDEERARRLTFVFVGAGYAGVEALAELSDLVEDALRYYPSLRTTRRRWVLVDAASRILPEIPRPLGDYAADELRRREVEIYVDTTLASVSADEAVLGNGMRIPTNMLVWTAGVAPNPLLREWPLPVDEKGRVEVDELLRVRGHEHVWALGDCAHVPNTRSDRPDPPTCQHALRQARRLARNIVGPPEPYGYRMLGQVATLGMHKGIAEVLDVRLRGFIGWWVTRSYHLYQLPTAQRKLRVVVDWTVALFFRRDIAELAQLGHPEKLS